jgi:hypothetical protein
MSKMDGLRAMREARYEARSKPPSKPRAPIAPKASQPVAPRPAEVQPAGADAESAGEQLCGHRAISGRTCTREHGHAAKSHRYA